MNEYDQFLESKRIEYKPSGFDPGELHSQLFDFQRDCVRWALRRGRAALWENCGLGKTFQQLVWSEHVHRYTKKPVLILTPPGVVEQIHEEGQHFGIPCSMVRDGAEIKESGIFVTNYEKLHRFDPSVFGGISLDESSILKSLDGKTRTRLISAFKATPYKLCCTATPSPNDFMELGNHAEFLGVMSYAEMLSMFFVHDGGDTSKWRLKGHAEKAFWKWISSWAVNIRKPSDLGYEDGDFTLPPLNVIEHIVKSSKRSDELFITEAKTLSERRDARKNSLNARCEMAVKLASEAAGKAIIWCERNDEQDTIEELLGDSCVSIRGATPEDDRIEIEKKWRLGSVPYFVSKPSVYGWGMNWQHCDTVIYCGISDSFESYYQSVRRCWRFGQTKPVTAHIVISEAEGAVLKNIKRKEQEANKMAEEMVGHMAEINRAEINSKSSAMITPGLSNIEKGDDYEIHNGDCVEMLKIIPDNSIGLSVFSPPFLSLYVYSNSERDLGNCKTDGEFYEHFKFVVKELFRVMQPGRNVAFHCMNVPAMKFKDGYIGLKDFRGDLIRMFQTEGFILHSEHVIWKDPLIEATRTKALGLMHKQLCKDSAMARAGIPDYLIAMRKPGENKNPVAHPNGLERFIGENSPNEGVMSHERWRRYASPVWMDINQTRTLQCSSAREDDDEKHVCPLQLDVIERAIELWSNPGDTVLSPFSGIGSEGYVAVQNGRKFVGAELKTSYWKQAVENLKIASRKSHQITLFK